MEHLSNYHKYCPYQHKNSHKLRNEMGHPVVNLMESQLKLRHSNGGKSIVEQIPASEERKKSKRGGL